MRDPLPWARKRHIPQGTAHQAMCGWRTNRNLLLKLRMLEDLTWYYISWIKPNTSSIQSVSPIALVFDFEHFITTSDISLWPILHAMYASGVSNDSGRRAHTHCIAGYSSCHTTSAFPHDGGIFGNLYKQNSPNNTGQVSSSRRSNTLFFLWHHLILHQSL